MATISRVHCICYVIICYFKKVVGVLTRMFGLEG